MGAVPALRMVADGEFEGEGSEPDEEGAGGPIQPGDVFDPDRMKDLYRKGVEALEQIAMNGNDNAKAGAAKALVDLFKRTAQAHGAKRKQVRVSWMDPLKVGPGPLEEVDELLT